MKQQYLSEYVVKAVKYAKDVGAGRVVSGELTQIVCARFIKELANRKKPSFPYEIEESTAERVCCFFECFYHDTGICAGEKMVLQPWQAFILVNIFGWVNKADGLRRYNEAVIFVARKNGKSFFAALLALYKLLADDEDNPAIFSAASRKEQAKLVLDTARNLVKNSKSLQRTFKVVARAHDIVSVSNSGIFRALASQGQSLDGLNPSLAIVDEVHSLKSPAVYDQLKTAMGARKNQLLLCISTAGDNSGGWGFSRFKTAQNEILSGKDGTVFSMVYEIDSVDSIFNKDIWIKANPNLNISVKENVLKEAAVSASNNPIEESAFATRRCNQWRNSTAPWMDASSWDACADKEISLTDLLHTDMDWFLGIDMGGRASFTSFSAVFIEPLSEVKYDYKAYVFGRTYCPNDFLKKYDMAMFHKWSRYKEKDNRPVFISVPGGATDTQLIIDHIRKMIAVRKPKGVAFDNWQSQWIAQELEKDGIRLMEFPWRPYLVSDPTKEFYDKVKERKIVHTGDPVLRNAMLNVEVRVDTAGNWFPQKGSKGSRKLIDGAVAAIMAFGIAENELKTGSAWHDNKQIDKEINLMRERA